MLDKNELLVQIRTFRHNVMNELDQLEDALMSLELPQVQQVQSNEAEDWLTVREACRALKISDATFYRQIKEGLIPDGVTFGPHSKRWRMSDIIAHQNEHRKDSQVCVIAPRRRGRPPRVRKLGEFINV